MENDASDWVQTRIDVAEMKGMLKQALSDQGSRINHLETDNVSIHARLSDKGKLLATHTEQIVGLQKAVNVIENDSRAKRAAGVATIAVIIAGVGLVMEIISRSGIA